MSLHRLVFLVCMLGGSTQAVFTELRVLKYREIGNIVFLLVNSEESKILSFPSGAEAVEVVYMGDISYSPKSFMVPTQQLNFFTTYFSDTTESRKRLKAQSFAPCLSIYFRDHESALGRKDFISSLNATLTNIPFHAYLFYADLELSCFRRAHTLLRADEGACQLSLGVLRSERLRLTLISSIVQYKVYFPMK